MSGSGSVTANVNLNTPNPMILDLGLDDVGVSLSGGEPIGLNTSSHLDISTSKPVTLNTNLGLDIQPLEIKPLVFELRLGRVVPTFIRLPYRHHVGFTLFGFELFGFTLAGESQIAIQDFPPPAP